MMMETARGLTNVLELKAAGGVFASLVSVDEARKASVTV
jgi:hypothetical protein